MCSTTLRAEWALSAQHKKQKPRQNQGDFFANPINLALAQELKREHEPGLVSVPIFLISDTGGGDENLVVSGTKLREIYDAAPETVGKIMARRAGADHGDMLPLPTAI